VVLSRVVGVKKIIHFQSALMINVSSNPDVYFALKGQIGKQMTRITGQKSLVIMKKKF
jgi:hypothetical protein